jgi:hypothetical protein
MHACRSYAEPDLGVVPFTFGKEDRVRLVVALIALLSVSASAMAQDAGSFALDAMTTPGRHFGAGYYVTSGLSIRPSLGLGYADQYGMTFNLGADARYELLTSSRVSPYLTAAINYVRSPYLVQYDAGGSSPASTSSNLARYGAGLGIRTRLKYGLSLVAEGRVMNSELLYVPGNGPYGQQAVQNGAHFEAALGISYVLN